MKAVGQYFHVVLFIMLYTVALTFKSVDETLVCDHSNESCWTVLLRGSVHYAVRFSMLTKMVLITESILKTLLCNHSNER